MSLVEALRSFVQSRGYVLDESSESELRIPVLPTTDDPTTIIIEPLLLLSQAEYEK